MSNEASAKMSRVLEVHEPETGYGSKMEIPARDKSENDAYQLPNDGEVSVEQQNVSEYL